MDESDIWVRNTTYRTLAELGRVPAAHEIAGATQLPKTEVVAAWRRLHEAHALVLEAGRDEIRMAHPFSAVPTEYKVHADGRWWFANCAWDAFGVCAALGTDGRIESVCPDCGDDIRIVVQDGKPDDESLVFHCLVPAAHWWDDVVFT